MKLQVGKIYRHSDNSKTRFKIEFQWSEQLFEGRALDPKGHLFGASYMFNSAGEALGWRGNSYKASLGWRLTDVEDDLYEFRLIYDGMVDTYWSLLTRTNPRYTYVTGKYLLRKKGDDSSLRIVSSDEIKAQQLKISRL